MTTVPKAFLRAFCLLVLAQASALAATAKAAKAVQSGDIHGVVNYCKPGRVNGTLVHIPGRIFQAKLGTSGEFTLNYVPPGSYSLTVEIPHSVPQTVTGITVRDNEISEAPAINICNDNDNDSFAEDVDCDDNNPAIHPGVFEGSSGGQYIACDGVDNNCNGQVDEGCPNCTDADQDSFCPQLACVGLTSGSVSCSGGGADCDDQNVTISPAQGEICDGLDNNCDGQVDEGFDLQNDVNNCASCGHVCSAPNASNSCSNGACTFTCGANGNSFYGDCNQDPSDGCETDVFTGDPNNCLHCGNVCPAGHTCAGGGCMSCSDLYPGFPGCP